MVEENATVTRKRGRPPLDADRKTRLQGYSANFPRTLWDYLQRAIYRESSPGDMWSVQRYLNKLIAEDMEKHEGNQPENKNKIEG